MSQILLYITLIVLAPAGTGEGYELSYKSSVEDTVFSLAQKELKFSKIISDNDGGIDLLSNALVVTDSGRCCYVGPVYQYHSYINSQQYKHYIRGPPAVS